MSNRIIALVIFLSLVIGVSAYLVLPNILFSPELETAFPLLGDHGIVIQNVKWNINKCMITVLNVGHAAVTLTTVYFDGEEVASAEGLKQLSTGIIATVTVSGSFVAGQSIHIKVMCEDGTFAETTNTVQF